MSSRTIKREDFFTDYCDFGFEWGKFVATEKGRVFIFRDHLDFWHELGKFVSDSK